MESSHVTGSENLVENGKRLKKKKRTSNEVEYQIKKAERRGRGPTSPSIHVNEVSKRQSPIRGGGG